MKKRISFIIVFVVFATCLTFMLSSCDEADTHLHSFIIKNPTESTLVKEATCTSKAVYYFECECGLAGENTYEYGSLLLHNFIEKEVINPTCIESGSKISECSLCKKIEEVTIEPLGHNVIIDPAVSPTCTSSGLTEGSHCGRCNTVLIKQKEIAAGEHVIITDEGYPATCTTIGKTAGSHCSVCNTVIIEQKIISPTGHSYSNVWSTDDTHHWNECSCGAKTNKSKHVYDTGVVEVPATETIEGKIKYSCTFCTHSYTVTTGTLAHTHTYSDTWSKDDSYHWHAATCSHTDLFKDKEIHDYDSGVITLAPTCVTEGVKTYTCNSCGNKKTESVAVLGHSVVTDAAVNPTCTTTGLTEGKHCSRCNEVIFAQKTIDALGHAEVVDAAVSPTCTNSGLTEGSHCSRCNITLVVQNRISALGHNSITDSAVSPTCTETGLTEGAHCIRCNTVLIAQSTINSLGHNKVIDEALSATCTKTGLTEGAHCSRCNEIIVKQEVLGLIDHKYSNELKNNETNHWYECVCGDKKDNTVHTFDTGVVEVYATETIEGKVKYTCTGCGYHYFVNTGTLNHTHTFETTISKDDTYHWYNASCGHDLAKDKEEHDYGDAIVITEPSCTKKGVKQFTCKTCNYVIYEDISPLGHEYNLVVTDPTCTTIGYTTHTCSRCNDSYTDSNIKALGHKTVVDKAVSPTCTEPGLTEGEHCSRCNETLITQKEVTALGHNSVTDSAVSPTCTKTGLTEGSHCLRCSTVLVSQTAVAALGHTEKASVKENIVSESCTEEGSYDSVIYCATCGGEVSRTHTIVDSLGHIEVVDQGFDATCLETGLTEGSHCSRCNEVVVKQVKIDVLGHEYETNWSTNSDIHYHKCSRCEDKKDLSSHNFGDFTVTVEPTIEATGSKERKCSVCDYKEVVVIDKLTVDLSTIKFDSIEVIYTGQSYSIYATNLNEGMTVSYEGNGVSEVGTHTVTAKFYSDNNVLLGTLTATITISDYDVVLPPIK